ncbi:MAG: gamma-glutamylcyclotransferase family protein [Candidatus Auribacterota bacterium]|jgi:cation transport regulator ChaC|uniref:Gamma-glutamylcyclotransferase n=1 Tax=Candidatus Auribacter fodinae TaxID=2093366 RepID=A0A3A4R1D7_9BACT|nr:MAG: gamma-glutamylcyclotransferase [Candidatus Auribacter fodinae]
MKNIVWFFSYSSNMNAERLIGRGVKFISKEPAYLENYLLKFNKKSVDGTTKANIVAATDQRVYGILYKMNAAELNKLDNIEGVTSGHYRRKTVPVCTTNGEVFMADVFIANDKYVCDDDNIRPSQQHLNTLITAACDNRLDQQYIEYLRSLASDRP